MRVRAAVSVVCLCLTAILADCSEPPLLRADSPAVEELRIRIRGDHRDVEARRGLADRFAHSESIEERREAAEALEEALLVAPGDVDLWVRLARLRARQKFRAESRSAYLRAVELAPDRLDLWDELACHDLLRYQRFDMPEYLADAEQANERVLALDPEYGPGLLREIRIAFFRGRAGEADSLARILRDADARHPLPPLLEGVRCVEDEDWAGAVRTFDRGLALLDSLTRREFRIPRLVDPLAELASGEAPDSARFVDDYWRWRDPTPSDAPNPRLLDHFRRMVLADLYFALEDRGLRGWKHGPGELMVRYGIPEDWSYDADVARGEPVRVGSRSPYSASSLEVKLGSKRRPLPFQFIDFAMNGVYVRPPSRATDLDLFLVAEPDAYEPPFREPLLDQEVEVLRFQDRRGDGWIEVAQALSSETWPLAVLREPERLVTRAAVYDTLWVPGDEGLRDWTFTRIDPLGRLVAVWRFAGGPDSLVVGVETFDLDGAGRAFSYSALPPRVVAEEGPVLSDLALLREVGFSPSPDSPYRYFDGEALPNPGHLYLPGEAIGLAFSAFHLSTDEEGQHRVRLRVTLARASEAGWIRVLLGRGGSGAANEIVFEASGPGDRMDQLFSVAVPPLPEGDYRLGVELTDLVSGSVATEGSALTIDKRGKR